MGANRGSHCGRYKNSSCLLQMRIENYGPWTHYERVAEQQGGPVSPGMVFGVYSSLASGGVYQKTVCLGLAEYDGSASSFHYFLHFVGFFAK